MAEQLWKGRFSKAVDCPRQRFQLLHPLRPADDRAGYARQRRPCRHAGQQGIISEQDCEDILNGLASIADDLASGRWRLTPTPRTCTPSWSRP